MLSGISKHALAEGNCSYLVYLEKSNDRTLIMKSKIGPFKLSWLITTSGYIAPPAEEICSTHELKFNIPPEIGEASVTLLKIDEGLDLYSGIHHLEKAAPDEFIPLADNQASFNEFTFNAQTWLSGMGCHLEYWQGRKYAPAKIVAGPGVDTFRFTKELDLDILISGGKTSEMRSIFITESKLVTLLGRDTTTDLLEKIGLNEHFKTVTLPIPPYISHCLKETMDEKYAGTARRLFAQAKTLEYLGRLVNFLLIEEKKVDRRHSTRVRELRDYLLKLEGQLPTLNELAQKFGLSARQLNREFSAEFGQTIFAFITAHRLEQAHVALQKSNVPMKVISMRLGYSHVNHFITAFSRKFGYSPGSLRR